MNVCNPVSSMIFTDFLGYFSCAGDKAGCYISLHDVFFPTFSSMSLSGKDNGFSVFSLPAGLLLSNVSAINKSIKS